MTSSCRSEAAKYAKAFKMTPSGPRTSLCVHPVTTMMQTELKSDKKKLKGSVCKSLTSAVRHTDTGPTGTYSAESHSGECCMVMHYIYNQNKGKC